MKNIYKITTLVLFGSLFTLTSCYEDPIGSSVTNYATITLNEPEKNPVIIAVGETYTELGATALEGETEIPVTISYNDGHFTEEGFNPAATDNAIDFYSAAYNAVNQDGFSAAGLRDIIVSNTGDFVTSIEGAYYATVVRNGVSAAQYNGMGYVLIWQTGDNTYEISDALGGYYDIGRSYGTGYINPGGIIVANDIPSSDFSTPGTQENISFGGPSTITSFETDAEAKTIDMVTTWEGYTFVIHVEQIQP